MTAWSDLPSKTRRWLTAQVMERDGPVCRLRLPGCTTTATEVDHKVPASRGGSHTVDNLRPACRHCNASRGNDLDPPSAPSRDWFGTGAAAVVEPARSAARVVVVIGPPGAGKTTWVRQQIEAPPGVSKTPPGGYVVIDFDALAGALAPGLDGHDVGREVRAVATAARSAAIAAAVALPVRVWLIHALPSPADLVRYRSSGWEVVTIDPGEAEVRRRCDQAKRPARALDAVARWYARTV